MKAVILAGGGDDLKPFTTTRPKPMISVSGRSLLENTVVFLKEVGIHDLVLVVGHCQEQIFSHFGRGHDFGVNISYVAQEDGGGIGDALLHARGRVQPGDFFLLVYGDVLTGGNIYWQTIQSFHSFRSAVAAICLTPSAEAFGNVYLDNEMRITRLVEKPMQPHHGNYVLAGVFVLPQDFLDRLEKFGGNMEEALRDLISTEGLRSSIWEEDWVDTQHPWDILRANRMVMDGWHEAVISDSTQLRGSVKVDGPVQIGDEVVIESGTVLQGPCYIGPGTFIGNNVLVRRYTSIGPKSVIGYGVELKNCVLFGSAKVGRLSFIGDSVVGEGVDIGSGTMTVNTNLDGTTVQAHQDGALVETGMEKLGSFIGDGAIIGAGNTLLAGTVIPAATIIPHHGTVTRGT